MRKRLKVYLLMVAAGVCTFWIDHKANVPFGITGFLATLLAAPLLFGGGAWFAARRGWLDYPVSAIRAAVAALPFIVVVPAFFSIFYLPGVSIGLVRVLIRLLSRDVSLAAQGIALFLIHGLLVFLLAAVGLWFSVRIMTPRADGALLGRVFAITCLSSPLYPLVLWIPSRMEFPRQAWWEFVPLAIAVIASSVFFGWMLLQAGRDRPLRHNWAFVLIAALVFLMSVSVPMIRGSVRARTLPYAKIGPLWQLTLGNSTFSRRPVPGLPRFFGEAHPLFPDNAHLVFRLSTAPPGPDLGNEKGNCKLVSLDAKTGKTVAELPCHRANPTFATARAQILADWEGVGVVGYSADLHLLDEKKLEDRSLYRISPDEATAAIFERANSDYVEVEFFDTTSLESRGIHLKGSFQSMSNRGYLVPYWDKKSEKGMIGLVDAEGDHVLKQPVCDSYPFDAYFLTDEEIVAFCHERFLLVDLSGQFLQQEEFRGRDLTFAAGSRDGRHFAFLATTWDPGDPPARHDNTVVVYDVTARRFIFAVHAGADEDMNEIPLIALSPDGSRIAVISDGVLRLYDLPH